MEEIELIDKIVSGIGLTPKSTIPLAVLALIIYALFVKKLNKLLTPIRFAIIEIQTLFQGMGKEIQYSLTETKDTPLKPTEFGWKLAKESGLEGIIESEKARFLRELDQKLQENAPFTAYDVQEKARELLEIYKNKPIMNPVKDYAFKNGVDVEVILRTGGLLLRDKYLKEHPELSSKS